MPEVSQVGRLKTVTQDGTVSFDYSVLGILESESYSGGTLGTRVVLHEYDAAHLIRTNLQMSTHSESSVGFEYDAVSRLERVRSGSWSAEYSYHPNSALLNKTISRQNGTERLVVARGYDALNRLTGIAGTPFGTNQSPWSFGYGYNAVNQRTDLALNDESEWRYDYDGLGQVTGGKRFWKDGTPVAGQQFEYDFDHSGNRMAARKGGTSAGTLLRESEYEPNLLNQYDSRTDLGYAEVQGIATAGAMVFVNGSYAGVERKGEYFRKELAIDNSTAAQYPQVQVQVSDGTNTIITPSGNLFIGKGLEVFEYDADGNLKTDGRWCYEWDAENRLVQMKSLTNGPAESWRQLEFKYDWQGRRIYIKETNLDTAQVVNERIAVYDGANLYAELTSSGTLLQTYIWGQDLSGTLEEAGGVGGLIGVKPAGDPIHFAAYDGNGNVAGLVNGSNGEISARYEYGPFGEPLRVSGPMGKANPIRWSSKYTDDTTQLVYYWHRYYKPRDGTWLSRDPIEELGGLNLYGFVGNSPIGNFDLAGLCNISGILGDLAQDAVKDRVKDLVKRQAIKSGAKAGAAAVSDGPLPLGDAVAAGITVYDGIGLYREIADLKALGETVVRTVCERLATNKNCLEDPTIRAEATEIIRKHSDGLLSNSKGKGDEIIVMLKELSQMLGTKCKPCKTQRHHSDPVYLGGQIKQDRTLLSPTRHWSFHGRMDRAEGGRFARWIGSDEIRDGNPSEEIERFKAAFYTENWNEFPDAGCDFFINKLF